MRRNIGILAFALVFFSASFLLEMPSFYSISENRMLKRFEKVFGEKERQLYLLFDEADKLLSGSGGEDLFSLMLPLGEEYPEGIDLFIYTGDTLVFWNSNKVDAGELDGRPGGEILFMGNNWSVRKERLVGEYRIVGLIKIKNEFPYENMFLANRFQDDFRMPDGTGILAEFNEDDYVIHDSWGKGLFALDFGDLQKYSPFQKHLSMALYFLGIILFLLYVRHLIRSTSNQTWKNVGIGMALLILTLLNLILMKIPVPDQIAEMQFFSPRLFAASNIFPSLSDLLTTSFFIFFLAYIFYNEFRLGEKYKGNIFRVARGVFFLVLVFYFQLVIILFRSLVIHSSISFETYRVLDISVYTFIGLFIIAMHFASFTMLMDKFFSLFRPVDSKRKLCIYVVIFAVLSLLAGFIIPGGPDIVIVLLISLVAGLLAWIRGIGKAAFRYSTFFLLVLLFSILSVYQISKYTGEKRHDEKKVLAVDLSAEHDPVAELLLKNMELDLSTDQELAYLIHEGYTDHLVIDDYLRGNYFRGFWSKYDMHFTLCSPADSLYIEPYEDTWYHCYDFFDELFADSRIPIPGSRFYFIDNMSGRISYFAGFKFFSADSLSEATLFLELDSRMVPQELGYPELLLRDKPRKGFLLGDYTYAKYSKGELITQKGQYSYDLKPDLYSSSTEEFEYTSFDGYEHLAYNLDHQNTIVVSNRTVTALNIAINFTYIFVFFFFLLTTILLIVNIPFLRRSLQLNIKNKIQYTMISVLFVSLFLIGAGTIVFSIRQYKERHLDSLTEKTQSVYIELMHKLEFETELTREWSQGGYANLDELLNKFSNVFFTDINLYDPEGALLATSRPEVFENKLLGEQMHPAAVLELAGENAAEFIQEENIGRLNYLSAYVPFRNTDNKMLAYLNLPYFTRQSLLTLEITNLVVAVVNLYVMLITISILIAVFVSRQITHPLRMLQDRFGKIRFGKGNEKIDYDAGDEIGILVGEYNHMVDELADSAEKLARSERESAWREMAKQIAHEIKNPLTPMKLSVQQLQRSTEKDPGNQKHNIDRISKTLIEQIDNLSAIATEFSNFAKMPRANNEEVDLGDKLRKICELFRSSEKINIDSNIYTRSPLVVYADPEQLSRVFINLLKNAIQSIPEDREGKIGISLQPENGMARVEISDNGKGIPEELKTKLFQPNFTTKSSGMGMGLAIVKNIIEYAGGTINFETEFGKGTTFIVELPLYVVGD